MAISLLTLFALGYVTKLGVAALIGVVSYKAIISFYGDDGKSTDYPTGGSPIVPPDTGDEGTGDGSSGSSDDNDGHVPGTDPSGFT